MNKMVGLVAAWGIALGMPAPGLAQSAHDIGGVGAMGLIGRGTIPEERPSMANPAPAPVTPVYMVAPVAAPAATPLIAPARPPAVPSMSSRAAGSVARASTGRSWSAVDRSAASQPARARENPYIRYDRSWLHGYWRLAIVGPGPSRASGGSGVGEAVAAGAVAGSGGRLVAPGRGLGWGLSAWVVGPLIYRWGYLDYSNPFLEELPPGVVAAGTPARPVDIVARPPADAALYEGLRAFGEARDAFRREEYMLALRRADDALKLIPASPSLHQFRGLVLLALHRYREAAAVYHATVAVVPGWDWTTMTRLYHNVGTYTRQLRMLESYSDENPRSAPAHFLLAMQYLTTGYAEAALAQLQQVARLRPDDSLTRRLIRELRPAGEADLVPASGRGGAGKLEGAWVAHPRRDATITLTIGPQGDIDWKVDERGQIRIYDGFGLHIDGTLTVTADPANALSGRVIWRDPRHFTFRILENRPGDAGLSFARSS